MKLIDTGTKHEIRVELQLCSCESTLLYLINIHYIPNTVQLINNNCNKIYSTSYLVHQFNDDVCRLFFIYLIIFSAIIKACDFSVVIGYEK